MTILQAIISEIEPYSLSDDAVEKTLLDSCGRLHGIVDLTVDDDYCYDHKKIVGLAAMMCLMKVRVLSSENLGGVSQSFDTSKLDARIRAIANDCGLPTDLLEDGHEPSVEYINVM